MVHGHTVRTAEAEDLSQRSSGGTDDAAFASHQRGSGRHHQNSIPGRMDNSDEDAAMMGGVHRASKMAGLRMWFEGVEGKKGAGNPSSFNSLIDSLPYALPIIAACILVMVLIAVRVLRKHQPNSTSYINAAFSNVKVKSGRRY